MIGIETNKKSPHFSNFNIASLTGCTQKAPLFLPRMFLPRCSASFFRVIHEDFITFIHKFGRQGILAHTSKAKQAVYIIYKTA